jgi:tetratricopeptide (TPR) repeat protein
VKRIFLILPFALTAVLAWCPCVLPQQQEATHEVPDGEDALIRKGLELRQTQQDEAALQEFRRAWALSKSGRALAQIALAEQALGRWLEAEEHLGQALKREGESWIAHNSKLLNQAMFAIQGHLGWLELSGESRVGWVRINGRQVATLPLTAPLRVPAGSVALEVQVTGYLPILRVVVVPARGLAREPLVFVSSGVPPKPTPPPAASAPRNEAPPQPSRATPSPVTPGKTHQTVGVIFGAAAIAALSTGVAFHVLREDRADTYKNLGCQSPTPPTLFSDCQSRYDGVNTATYLMTAGYAAAAVLSGAAVYLLLGSSNAETTKATSAATDLPLRCGPSVGPGLVCIGRF